NEEVGTLIGQGFLTCLTSEGISAAQVFVLNGGEDTDPNAISFATGYNKAVWGQAAKSVTAPAKSVSGGATLVGENFAPGWSNTAGGTIFQQEYPAPTPLPARLEANDGLAGAVITDLNADGVQAGKFPTTGQDATAQERADSREGGQGGAVDKAGDQEAQ